MAGITIYHIVAIAICYVVYRIVSSKIESRRFEAFANENGCKPPLNISKPLLVRVKRLREILRSEADGKDLFEDFIIPDMRGAGTIQGSNPFGKVVFQTADPAVLQAVLATQFKDFEVGDVRYNAFSPLLGKSIFTSDGPFWEHSRALFRPQFARENINDLEMTDKAAKDLIEAIGPMKEDGWSEETRMMSIVPNFTLDTATHFLFGESIDSQAAATALRRGEALDFEHDPAKAAKLADATKFRNTFIAINEVLVKRIRLGTISWMADGWEFRKAIGIVRKFTGHFVQRAIDTAASPSNKDDKKNSLLNNLATQTQDRTELANQTLAILLAGSDTTSALLGWCFTRFALHPEIYAKLRNIILEDFTPHSQITFERLKSCRYLQHFLSEVLRLHPTVPLNGRIAVRDTTLPCGGGPDEKSPFAIQKGTPIVFSVYVMHRRFDLWGADALEFRPERWDERRIPAWQFLPFLGGPRICIGQQFALTEASFLLVRILQEYEAVEPVDRAEMAKLGKGLGVTMFPGDGCRVRFRKART